MPLESLIAEYQAGPQRLRDAVAGLSESHLDAVPIANSWSIRQIICHLADFEPIYADRMKRVLAESEPTFFGGDPDVFAAGLYYARRSLAQELDVISSVRAQMVTILQCLSAEDFQRIGIHSNDGPLTIETLLKRITGHIPHHVQFIEAKRKALGV